MRRRRASIATLAAIAAAVLLPAVMAGVLPPVVRSTIVAIGLFILPGRLLVRTLAGAAPKPALGVTFAASLAVLAPALAAVFALALSLEAFRGWLLAIVALLALVGTPAPAAEASAARDGTRASLPLRLACVCIAAALTIAAAWLTATGSIDKWWYLAYVRSYLDAGALGFDEPFLGSTSVNPRFAFNAWLSALAAWSQLARVDPLWLYERACPVLLVPIGVSAQLYFARALLRDERAAWLATLSTTLMWAGGSLLPVITRAPEDKLLSVAILAPALWGAVLNAVDAPVRAATLLVAAIAIASATVHPLSFALAVVVLAPFLVIRGWQKVRTRARIAAIAGTLALASAYPVMSGLAAREYLEASGASSESVDHPVVRVHQGRDRVIDLGDGVFLVDPRLLAHPIPIVALLSIFLLRRREARERAFLLPAALVPLTIAFLPPIAMAAGAVVLPWMVHRVLWVIPFGALAAVGMSFVAARWRIADATLALTLVLVVAPWAANAIEARTRAERAALRLPEDRELARALDTLRALPPEAIVAASSELSERLPGLTGRHVLAASDRATIVFSGSRAAGEARLRARASVFAGLWRPATDAPAPTHVLLEPGGAAERYCARRLLESEHYLLCRFAPVPPAAGIRLAESAARPAPAGSIVVRPALADGTTPGPTFASCTPEPDQRDPRVVWNKPGPWSAAVVTPTCTVRSRGEERLQPSGLTIVPVLGRSVDELLIRVQGRRGRTVRWNLRTRRRVTDRETLRFSLPSGAVDEVEINITPTFLPFLKLDGFALDLVASGGNAEP